MERIGWVESLRQKGTQHFLGTEAEENNVVGEQ